jgi:hypothetical protein
VFTFVTLYVTAFSGSLFNTALAGLINSPMEIAKTIATGLGSVDYYFMTYIVTKIGIRLGVYLLRLNVVFPWGLWRLVEYLCRSFAGDHERTEQLKMSGSLLQKPKPRLGGEFAETILVESPYYDWILVDLSVTLSLTLLYGVMSPQMVLVGFLFFLSYAAMIRYNFLYVYVQEYDSGGDFCFTLINFAYFSLATSLAMVHMHMAAVMSDWKSAKVSVPSTICAWIATFAIPLLIIVVVAVWIFQHNRFQRVCETLSLEQAMAYDKKHSSKYQSGSLEDLFEDPSVIAARRICGTR